MFWPLQGRALDKADLVELTDFIGDAEHFTQGEKVQEFEQAYSDWVNCKHSVFVNSGSTAYFLLIIALRDLHNWNKGDEVIVSPLSWPTTITAIIELGLKPVFVDINLSDLSFDYTKIQENITENTRAISVVHLLGVPADIEVLKGLVAGSNIVIIEDCCEAHGATTNNMKVGGLTSGGVFSFYWNHHITTIEGGMVTVNDDDLYNQLLLKRSHGLARYLPRSAHDEIRESHTQRDFNFLFLTGGFNVRNTEMHAVLGLSQLKKIDQFIHIRNQNYASFVQLCKKYNSRIMTIEAEGISSFCLPFFLYNKTDKFLLYEELRRNGIDLRPIIGGNVLMQPFLSEFPNNQNYLNADFIDNNCFYIGNNQFVNKTHLEKLSHVLERVFGRGD